MTWPFYILAALTLASAVSAMSLRNLVHCALCLVATFVGLAGLYLQLDAEFAGLVQILVYVGAVTILILFAILLTRSGEVAGGVFSRSWPVGLAIGVLVAGVLTLAIANTALPANEHNRMPATVSDIGQSLMSTYVIPMEAMALLLTAAMIGAVIIAMHDRRS